MNLGNYIVRKQSQSDTFCNSNVSAGTFHCVVLWQWFISVWRVKYILGIFCLCNCKVALVLQLHILYVFIFQKVIVMTPLVSPAYLTSHFSAVYVKLSQTIRFIVSLYYSTDENRNHFFKILIRLKMLYLLEWWVWKIYPGNYILLDMFIYGVCMMG